MYELIIKIFNYVFRTSRGVCGGWVALGNIAAERVLTQASYVQNRGADGQVLVYEDEYGNSGSVTMKENEITPALISKVKVGSGASMYLVYSK